MGTAGSPGQRHVAFTSDTGNRPQHYDAALFSPEIRSAAHVVAEARTASASASASPHAQPGHQQRRSPASVQRSVDRRVPESDLLEAGIMVPPSPADQRRLTFSSARNSLTGHAPRGTPLRGLSMTPEASSSSGSSRGARRPQGHHSTVFADDGDDGEITIARGLISSSHNASYRPSPSRRRDLADPDAPTPEYRAVRFEPNDDGNGGAEDDDEDSMWLTGDISGMLKA
jgi:hypothetical protein